MELNSETLPAFIVRELKSYSPQFRAAIRQRDQAMIETAVARAGEAIDGVAGLSDESRLAVRETVQAAIRGIVG
jgi:hypothetical protein